MEEEEIMDVRDGGVASEIDPFDDSLFGNAKFAASRTAPAVTSAPNLTPSIETSTVFSTVLIVPIPNFCNKDPKISTPSEKYPNIFIPSKAKITRSKPKVIIFLPVNQVPCGVDASIVGKLGVGVLIMGTFKFDPFDTIPLILFIYILQILNYLEYIYK